MPSVVNTGSTALRKAYVTMTVRPVRPLARAVRTNSDARVASIEARVMRASGAKANTASVAAGMTICARAARNTSPCPATALSIRKKPVRRGGSVRKLSSRPSGAGAQPSTK